MSGASYQDQVVDMLKLSKLGTFIFGLLTALVITLVPAQEPNFNLTSGKSKSGYNLSNPTDTGPYDKEKARRLDLTKMRFGPAPADAVAYALADCATLSKGDQ